MRRGRQTSLTRRPDMGIVDEVDTARTVLEAFCRTYTLTPDGTLRDRAGREAFDNTVRIVTDAMAVLA